MSLLLQNSLNRHYVPTINLLGARSAASAGQRPDHAGWQLVVLPTLSPANSSAVLVLPLFAYAVWKRNFMGGVGCDCGWPDATHNFTTLRHPGVRCYGVGRPTRLPNREGAMMANITVWTGRRGREPVSEARRCDTIRMIASLYYRGTIGGHYGALAKGQLT